jgi:hypothetical protein
MLATEICWLHNFNKMVAGAAHETLLHSMLLPEGGCGVIVFLTLTARSDCRVQNGVFGRSDLMYQPAWVFSKNLGPNYPKVSSAACFTDHMTQSGLRLIRMRITSLA